MSPSVTRLDPYFATYWARNICVQGKKKNEPDPSSKGGMKCLAGFKIFSLNYSDFYLEDTCSFACYYL